MIRLVRLGGRWYGLKVDRIDVEEVENIEAFVNDGYPVVFCYDLADAEDHLGIINVEMVDKDK